MKRKVFAFLLCFVLVMAMPITARADMGPKPSVRIEFTGIEGETYYGTLLSKHNSTGPASAWNTPIINLEMMAMRSGTSLLSIMTLTVIISCRNCGTVLIITS